MRRILKLLDCERVRRAIEEITADAPSVAVATRIQQLARKALYFTLAVCVRLK